MKRNGTKRSDVFNGTTRKLSGEGQEIRRNLRKDIWLLETPNVKRSCYPSDCYEELNGLKTCTVSLNEWFFNLCTHPPGGTRHPFWREEGGGTYNIFQNFIVELNKYLIPRRSFSRYATFWVEKLTFLTALNTSSRIHFQNESRARCIKGYEALL